ncbi:MAG: TRAP transporter small permease [Burkholderiaceae bacterium]|nr:TRAP transporter small permease [Burkholderiaceae bacterium]
MRRGLDLLYKSSAYCGAFFVFGIFVVMIGGALTRPLGVSLIGTDDLVSWMCAAAAFLPMADAFRRGDFVRMMLVVEKLAPARRRYAELLALLIATGASAALAYWANFGVYESWRYDEMSIGLLIIPIWIPQLAFAIGANVLLIAVIDELVAVCRGDRPAYQVAVDERHGRGDFSEDI